MVISLRDKINNIVGKKIRYCTKYVYIDDYPLRHTSDKPEVLCKFY